MKSNKFIFVVITIIFLISVLALVFVSNKETLKMSLESNDCNVLAFYKKGIANYGIWNIGTREGDYLFYLIKEAKADNEYLYDGKSLNIYDKDGELIYEERANSFGGIEILDILRQSRGQLIIKSVNYGGSGRFFKILDYREGKIISITDENDTIYSGGVEILPQYQKGVKPYSEPYQILLTDTLTSSSPEATVLRYVNDRYVSVGILSQTEVGDFIDKSISERK